MPDTSSESTLVYEGFVSIGGSEVALYRTSTTVSSEGAEADAPEPSAPPSALFHGSMTDLVELLKHHEVQVAFLEQLPFPQPGERTPPDEVTKYAEDVTSAVRDALSRAGYELAESGVHIGDLATSGELAERMSALIPRISIWDSDVGPFYDSTGVAALLGKDDGAIVRQMAEEGRLLELTTADGVSVYPTFQFTADGRVFSGLNEVIGAFEGTDKWMLASWLVSNSEALGSSPMEALARESELEHVLALARDTASRWRR